MNISKKDDYSTLDECLEALNNERGQYGYSNFTRTVLRVLRGIIHHLQATSQLRDPLILIPEGTKVYVGECDAEGYGIIKQPPIVRYIVEKLPDEE